MSNHTQSDPVNLTRRGMIRLGACGLVSFSLADLLQAQSSATESTAKIDSMILIWLGGGPSTIDMWDPKPQSDQEIRGPFQTIATALPGIYVSEYMRDTAMVLDQCTLVRSLCHNIPDHVPGSQYVMTGNKPDVNLTHPSIGALVSSLLSASAGMPSYLSLGESLNSGAGFLGAQYDPFQLSTPDPRTEPNLTSIVLPDSLSSKQLREREQLRNHFDATFLQARSDVDIVPTLTRFQQQAIDILTSDRIRNAFDLTNEKEAIDRQYGESPIGRSALIARRLVEAGARVVSLGTSGWDTHSGNFVALRQLLPQLDRALAGLVTDLKERGMLDKTLVVCGGEFGRTPVINSAAGRDHWSRAFSYFLAGGSVRRGFVHGETDERGFDPISCQCSPDDLAATIFSQFGFSPQLKVTSTSGRPIVAIPNGRVLTEILS